MNRRIRQLSIIFFVIISIMCMSVTPVFGASTRKCYSISTGNTTVYKDTALKVKYGAIYASDEITVLDVTSRYCKVNYPTSNGRTKTGYIYTSAILRGTTGSSYRSRAKITTYKRPGGSSYGYISKGDTVKVLGTYGNYTQVKYPVSGGYKFAFIATSNYNQYIKSNSNTSTSSSQSNVNKNVLVSEKEIQSAASRYGISQSSNAYKALKLINSKYYSRLSGNKQGTNVFLFEGAGNNSSAGSRMNAMCVVVSGGKIIYINRNSSTIPDYPFSPSKNGGSAMPTLKDGVYGFTTVNHRGQYAALNVSGAKVVRFKSKNSYYNSTSTAINLNNSPAFR